ncbi:MAG: M42 family peptidase [Clostridia bacterium]|nr:M42 family peptidase [Clostridia bacterium]MBQ2326702.1 M42 family peptidase [Clostridia bacterium]MBQ3062563.1 M42 family peptidase [Clostridia bacterium]MBQ5813282.1 M42 family peptidase [Clostridia bacterium]
MNDINKVTEILEKLCSADGVAGYEEEVRVIIEEMVKPYADEMFADALGNLFVFKKGKNRREKPLVVSAHMDEVGFMAREITEKGMIKFLTVGSVDPRVMIGRKMKVGPKKVPGVISLKAIHLTTPKERTVAPAAGSLYIDIGATSKKEAEKYVQIGDPCYFDSPYEEFGDQRIKAKAIDDRVGCAVMVQLLSEELEYDTWFVFGTNEEIGGNRGAVVAANRLNPGHFLVIEGTTACDVPDVPAHGHSTTQGEGVAVSIMDKGSIYSRPLIDAMTKRATEEGIKWQYRRSSNGFTDARAFHSAAAGAKGMGIAVPTRYIHSAVNVAYKPDIEAVLRMARLYVKECSDNA